jgi:hypothetical protein
MIRSFAKLLLSVSLGMSCVASAQHTSEPIYQDPFDIGAGGSSLTRASRDGRLFSNPAILPYGGDKVRWAGMSRSALLSKDWIEIAQGDVGEDTAAILSEVASTPLHAGSQGSVSFVGANYGYSTFQVFEADIELNEFGEYGSPNLRIQSQFYSGTVFSLAARMPGAKWLSGGVTLKYLGVNEIDESVELLDTARIEEIQTEYTEKFSGGGSSALNMGAGYDVGILTLFQGNSMDFSMAAKVDDVGGTKLAGEFLPTEIKQTAHAGIGLSFHSMSSGIHFSLDVRDLEEAYEEPEFKRVRAGTKITLFNYVGLSTGISHGYPSYGAEVDLLLFRVTGTYYTKEMGDSPGVNPRRLYMATVSFGTDF